MIEKHEPGRKQRHASRCALEELRADLALNRTDMPTNRWLCDMEAQSGASHISLLSNGDEITDLRKTHVIDRVARSEVGQELATTVFVTCDGYEIITNLLSSVL